MPTVIWINVLILLTEATTHTSPPQLLLRAVLQEAVRGLAKKARGLVCAHDPTALTDHTAVDDTGLHNNNSGQS